MKGIDCHHHLWNYSAGDYGWLGPGMETLKRDFSIADLKQESAGTGMDASLVVQARQSIAETETLLDLALREKFVRGVVGWLPIASPDFPGLLERFAGKPLLKGLRHVIQDEADPAFILGLKFNAGIGLLEGTGLVYEILVYERQLPQTIRFVEMHPDQVFVLDHCAKPRIADGEIEPWRSNIRELAKHPNVSCKISGLVTEADPGKDLFNQCADYIAVIIEEFGPDRCLFGSDWPVMRLACGYKDWHGIVTKTLAGLPQHDMDKIFCRNTVRIYGLEGIP